MCEGEYRIISKNKTGYLIQKKNKSKFEYEYIKKCNLCKIKYLNPIVNKEVLIKNFDNFKINLFKFLNKKEKIRLNSKTIKFEFDHDLFRLIFKNRKKNKCWYIIEESFFDTIYYLNNSKKIYSNSGFGQEIIFPFLIKPTLTWIKYSDGENDMKKYLIEYISAKLIKINFKK